MAIRLIALLGAGLFPLSAVASDYGTYRPGNTYMSVPATSPEQCISQCQGDAQCKGWNFVQVSPVRMICEFNARKVPPIASAISISGDNATTMDSYRVIPGGQRTVRVGQMPKMVSRPSSVTRIGAMTPPSRPQVTAAAHRSRPVQRTQVQRPVPRLPAAPQIRPEPQTASAPAYAARTMPAPSSSFKPQLDTMTPAPQYSRPQYEQPQYDQPRYEQSPQAEAAPRFRPQLDSIAPMPEIAPMPAPTPATAPMSGPSTEHAHIRSSGRLHTAYHSRRRRSWTCPTTSHA